MIILPNKLPLSHSFTEAYRFACAAAVAGAGEASPDGSVEACAEPM